MDFFKYKIKFLLTVIYLMVLYPIVVLFPRNPRKILFGAWWGRQFADNPKYFLKFLIEHNAPYEYYWLGNENIRSVVENFGNVHFIKKGSFTAIWHILTAKWAMWAISFKADISSFPTFGRIKQISFWHGPGFKGYAYISERLKIESNNSVIQKIRYLLIHFDVFAHTQEALASFSTQKMVEDMQYESPKSFRPERSRAFGTARIDYLIQNKENIKEIQRVREKYAQILGLPINKKWYLYMPTWRKGLELKFSFLKSHCLDEYQQILERQDAIIIEKQHPQVMNELGIEAKHKGSVYVISNKDAALDIDTQELLLVCQRMITDYSTCNVDFMTMNKPILYFMYDYDFYIQERGLMYSVDEVVAGPIAHDEEHLIKFLSLNDEELLMMKAPRYKELYECETGHACEQFARWVGLNFKE